MATFVRTRGWRWLPCLWLSAACGSGSGSDPGGGDPGTTGGGTGGAAGGSDIANTGAAGSDTLGTAGSGNASGGSSSISVQSCASSAREAQLLPAHLLFLLDRSGSMNCNPPNGRAELADCRGVTQLPAEATKWQVTNGALDLALTELSALDNVSVGLTVFPMVGGNPEDVRLPEQGPDVPIRALDPAQLDQLTSFLGSVVPSGETPLANATLSSYEFLRQQIVGGELEGNIFVVLMTDGSETASPTLLQQLVDTWVGTAASGFGIRTFAIGAPGSEPARATLSKIAADGRTPQRPDCNSSGATSGGIDPSVGDCHFDMTGSTDFAEDLAQALIAISRDNALACDFAVPTNPSGGGVNLNEVNVTFTTRSQAPVQVLKDSGGTCGVDAEGWQFSPDHQRIVLCGEICQRVKSQSDGRVDIVLGCPTQSRLR
jgi:hypothetical protein